MQHKRKHNKTFPKQNKKTTKLLKNKKKIKNLLPITFFFKTTNKTKLAKKKHNPNKNLGCAKCLNPDKFCMSKVLSSSVKLVNIVWKTIKAREIGWLGRYCVTKPNQSLLLGEGSSVWRKRQNYAHCPKRGEEGSGACQKILGTRLLECAAT